MKYLFAAIDARQGRVSSTAGRHSGRPRHNANELKKLLADANEGIDEKNSTHDFVDTLERIVNEIKNTTEHSAAFLQKVKKSDVPDYYDVIKKPMDLGTLMKKVKAQSYRDKKTFAADLDLIWSNCLIYNSHPTHPLRRSAEILRQKSNQLLEFISDPALPSRSTLAASLSRGRGDTPGFGDDEDGEGENDTDEEETRLALVNRKLLNGVVNGDGRDSTASPGISRSATPTAERILHKKAGPGRLGRTRSPSPLSELAFEERAAIIRDARHMLDFSRLDAELSRLDSSLALPPIASTSSLGLAGSNASTSASAAPLTNTSSTPNDLTVTPAGAVASRAVSPAVNGASPRPLTPTSQPSRLTTLIKSLAPEATSQPDKPPEAVWWETMSSGSAASAGIPAYSFLSRRQDVKSRINGNAAPAQKVLTNGKVNTPKKALNKAKTKAAGNGLETKMMKNVAALRDIERLNHKLSVGAVKGTGLDPSLMPWSDDEDAPVASTSGHLTIPQKAFRTRIARVAAGEALKSVSHKVLLHSGFDSVTATSMNVLSHVISEYITNIGRTMRFYLDRYGQQMSPEQILLHSLSENGVSAPDDIRSYVENDIERYGSRLSLLRAKLQRARREQLESFENSPLDDEQAVEDEQFLSGDFSRRLGEDFFGFGSLGLDKESMPIPARLLRGDHRGPSDKMELGPGEFDLKYPPPPPHIPLTPASIDSQIGLLRPLFLIRQKTEAGLIDDFDQVSRPKMTRNKVPPTSGRIPVKTKRKPDESIWPIAKPKKKKSELESES